jgi:hypothetical protein
MVHREYTIRDRPRDAGRKELTKIPLWDPRHESRVLTVGDEWTARGIARRRGRGPGIVADGDQEFAPLTGSPQSPGRGRMAGW